MPQPDPQSITQPANTHSYMSRRVVPFGTTIFGEMTSLARQLGAINLGQGFPDFDGPPEIIAAATKALQTDHNQYAPGLGYRDARQAVADHALRFYGQQVDPDTEVAITAGATEAMFMAIQGLLDPGDEVILFQPAFDTYAPQLRMAGAVARYVTLHAPDWTFDPAELAAAFTPQTRAIIVNTPHNPTGKVFSRAELTTIAELCVQHDVIALTDEVYEHLLYDEVAHVRLATLPDMADRTLTISSLGKTFSVTGWKIGWVIGAPELVASVVRAHQFNTFCVASPLQAAIPAALAMPDSYYAELRAAFQARRDYLIPVLESVGFQVWQPAAGYFIVARWRDAAPSSVTTDTEYAQWLIHTVGVACIPVSAFYPPESQTLGQDWIRFAVCKTDATLHAAADRLARLRELVPSAHVPADARRA